MPRPVKRRRAVTPAPSHVAPPAPRPAPPPAAPPPRAGGIAPRKLDAFLNHLGRTGSVTLAAVRAAVDRRALYRLKEADEAFAARWHEALSLGIERLQDDAMRRALDGTRRPVWRGGRQVGSVIQYDNRLLQFLLKAHKPETYGDRAGPAAAGVPFDLARRLAAARPRLAAHLAEKQADARAPDGKTPEQRTPEQQTLAEKQDAPDDPEGH